MARLISGPLLADGGVDTDLGHSDLESRIGELAVWVAARAGRVLLLPPDHTRLPSRAGEITYLLFQQLTRAGCTVAVLPALGTHARMSDTDAAQFDVAGIITSAIADSVPAATASRVRSRFVEDRRAIGDPRRTRQVVVNLLTNAAKFSAPDEPIDIIVERDPGWVSVAVVDRGVGIPLDEQHLLFQRFSRLASGQETPGSGIGLFIARSLVEAQHGQITVDSAPGRGSTFRFSLPAAT